MRRHQLFVGTIGEGVFHSQDHGETFHRACDGMPFVECYVRALASDPADPSALYLGNESGVWVSRDFATSWHCLLPLADMAVWSLLVRGGRIIAGTSPARIFRSDDGGATWQEARATLTQQCPRIQHTRVTCLAADPSSADRVWAGVEIDGIRLSEDGGRTWREIGEGLTSLDIHALAIVPGPGPRLLATTNNDLNISDDGGRTWRAANIDSVLPWKYTRAMAQKAGNPEVIYLGSGDRPPGWQGATALSRDGGKTWTRTMLELSNSTVWSFAVHPADPELVYSASVSGQVYRSTDGGATWHKLGVEFGEVRALAWLPA